MGRAVRLRMKGPGRGGGAGTMLLSLVADGRGQDAMALGVLGSVLGAPEAPAGTSFALGGLHRAAGAH